MKKTILQLSFLLILSLFVTNEANALTPIARSDVVPYQRIDTGVTFNFGVVAFHKEGIKKIDFAISGQGYSGGIKTATEMTHNPRTDVWEYWVEIAASEFSSDGAITVTPTATGNDGDTRVLEAVTMYVNPNGTLPSFEAWVDANNGNNSTGTIGDPTKPYLTIAGAMDGLLAVNNNDLSSCTIYLQAGAYDFAGSWKTRTVTDEWLRITRAEGVAKTDVVINAGGAAVYLNKLKVEGITIESQGADISNVVFFHGRTINLWTDDCRIIGSGRYNPEGGYSNPIYYHSANNDDATYWSTDCYTYDVKEGYRKIKMVRGATLEKIGNDVFHNTPVVINSRADDINNGGSGDHADCYQLHTTGPVDPQDNLIVYGYKATNAHYQGFFLGSDELPPDNIRTNIAFVNVLVEMREPPNNNGTGGFVLSSLAFGGGWDHLLIWNSTFPYAPAATSGILPLTNSSFVGNVFRQLGHNDGLLDDHNPDISEPGNTFNNEFLNNHYYQVYGLTPECTGTSIQEEKDYPCPHWFAKAHDSDPNTSMSLGDGVLDSDWKPLADSVLLNRFPSVVPVDIYGVARGSVSDVGAIEQGKEQPTSPAFRSDVDNSGTVNTSDALLTLRKSLGLDMSTTSWQDSASTGDANCDGTTNSTDALLILRFSLGLDMGGGDWCE